MEFLPTILSVACTVLLFIVGLIVKTYAHKQGQVADAHDKLAEAHATRLKELEAEAHATRLKLEGENKEQAKSQHGIDLRLTAAEASLHATKNNIMGIKDELSEIRSQMVRREDLHSGMETIIQRIDAMSPNRRK